MVVEMKDGSPLNINVEGDHENAYHCAGIAFAALSRQMNCSPEEYLHEALMAYQFIGAEDE